MRADLHVHSRHSGLNTDLAFLRSRDCYSSPLDVYRVARARGMDLVTITDHDSIDGCLEILDRHPEATDVLVAEEVSCWWPGVDLQVHIGAYGLTEALHGDVQRLRGNVHDVVACLRAAGVVTIVNHPFHFYRGQVPLADYLSLIGLAGGVEARNGAMLPAHNRLAERIGRSLRRGLALAGGSDAHALHRIGRTWTDAPGWSRDEFLASLRAGRATVGGAHGSVAALAGDIYRVVGRYWQTLATGDPPLLDGRRRALGAAFSVATLPFEFTPLLVSFVHKRREAAVVRACRRALDADEVAEGPPSGATLEAEP